MTIQRRACPDGGRTETMDHQNDRLGYELYDLTNDEIRIVEEAMEL